MIDKICYLVLCTFLALMPALGILWILSVPDYFEMGLVSAQAIVIILGLATGAAILKHPYGEKAGILELLLAFAAFGVWLWMSINLQQWYFDMAERPPRMWRIGRGSVFLLPDRPPLVFLNSITPHHIK